MLSFVTAGILSASSMLMAAQPAEVETRLADQKDVALTVYNGGLSMVRDVRDLQIPTGEVQLRFMDVTEQIQPETVSLRSLTADGSVQIIEQNYEYDLISPEKMMEKYVGRDVSLVNFSNEIGFTEVQGKLLSMNNGPVYEIDGRIFLGHPGTVVLPQIPENLVARPSLIWRIENTQAAQSLEATYLTNGIAWTADYVINLAKDDQSLDLSGWVTMDNQSGATFTNAAVKLVAGDVNRSAPPQAPEAMGQRLMSVATGAMPQEEAFAEYHLYTMPRRTTIKQNQKKQLALLDAAGIKATKKYEYRGQEWYFSQPTPESSPDHVSVSLEFENREDNQLGVPLPAGRMWIYQEDSDGLLQFAGEDRIEHTPKDETIRLTMGQAFDVVAERKQTDFKRVSDRVFESSYEITLRNHKSTDVVVEVVEPVNGEWRVLQNSHQYTKRDAHTLVFAVAVPKDGETVVNYTVQVKY